MRRHIWPVNRELCLWEAGFPRAVVPGKARAGKQARFMLGGWQAMQTMPFRQ